MGENGRKWCWLFEGGRINVHDGEHSGRAPSLVTDDLKEKVNVKFLEGRRFRVSPAQERFGYPLSEK
jgi:hypothetical protein